MSLRRAEMAVGSGMRAIVAVRSERPFRISRIAVVSPGSHEGCTAGWEANAIEENGRLAQGEFAAGPHEIRATFGAKPAMDEEMLLDLTVVVGDEERCRRVPFGGSLVLYERLPGWTYGTRIAMETFHVHGERALLSLQGSLGHTLGPLRTELSLGLLSGVNCYEDVCGTDGADSNGQPNLKYGWAFPASTSIRVYPFHTGSPTMALSHGVGARYSLLYSHVPALEGEYNLLAHGLHGMVLFGFGDLDPKPFRHRLGHRPLVELEIPLGVWTARHQGISDLTFNAGASVNFNIPL